jgi:progressive ankylosis protein
MRNFTHVLNAGSTALLLLVLVPPVYDFLMTTLLGLPEPVSSRVYGALWLLLPWPAAIGYRRFLHGVLIRSGRTRLVAYGTMLRLAAMSATAFALFKAGALPGAWVGAAALSTGVLVEAIAARVMAAGAVRELHTGPGGADTPGVERAGMRAIAPTAAAPLTAAASARERASAPGYREIARFYYPLALTSLIGLTVQPILTFFMGRAPEPVTSLAVFPVVYALSFVFRSGAFAYQEAAIALVGAKFEHVRRIGAFGGLLAVALSGGLAAVAWTPLAFVWFERISGLPPELVAPAVAAARLAVLLPGVAVILSFQQAMLVRARRTPPITAATAVEVATIAGLFVGVSTVAGLSGVHAAIIALVGGRVVGNLVLARSTLRAVRRARGRAG